MKQSVSSIVANPAIHPLDLVDGDLATAWGSRTNDLAGAWVAFRVPADAHITALLLAAGYSHVAKDGDYFTMNQRIRRIRVVRLDG